MLYLKTSFLFFYYTKFKLNSPISKSTRSLADFLPNSKDCLDFSGVSRFMRPYVSIYIYLLPAFFKCRVGAINFIIPHIPIFINPFVLSNSQNWFLIRFRHDFLWFMMFIILSGCCFGNFIAIHLRLFALLNNQNFSPKI